MTILPGAAIWLSRSLLTGPLSRRLIIDTDVIARINANISTVASSKKEKDIALAGGIRGVSCVPVLSNQDRPLRPAANSKTRKENS